VSRESPSFSFRAGRKSKTWIRPCQTGKITTVIDRRYALSEVPQALRYLGEGNARGKIIIIVE
jgi:NADPH:quinone reductase-like Zn-dependent oxidoreductase